MTRPALRLPYHRSTTAHAATLYPFSVHPSLGHRGTYLGLDLLAGAAELCWDPFEAYTAGLVTNPNAWILGEPGNGKSALVKTLLWRQAAIYGHGPGGRWTAIVDPKGEYRRLAEHLGLTTIRLTPGGTARLNPLATTVGHPADETVLRAADLCAALVATILERPLTQPEDAQLFRAIEQLHTHPGLVEPTLQDLAAILDHHPDPETTALRYALDKLLTRSLRGMFDGPSTVTIDPHGPGLVLDLSAIPLDAPALPLVMVAAAGWLQHAITTSGGQRIQVFDEAWALLGNRHTAAYLQSCFKLGRAQGIANLCVTHRASDLGAQADDGTATAKIAAGLLADAATKIILRQAPDQIPTAISHFGLTDPEARIISQLARGRSLWKIGAHTALLHHLLTPAEHPICNTDTRMHPGALL